eukprot:1162069-Pelagomonas_calceolata.AAC.2
MCRAGVQVQSLTRDGLKWGRCADVRWRWQVRRCQMVLAGAQLPNGADGCTVARYSEAPGNNPPRKTNCRGSIGQGTACGMLSRSQIPRGH